MARFYPEQATVPDELRTGELVLRMLRATDVALDYDAVIDSRAILLIRSSGRWPRPGFTLAENLADLEMHEREHRERLAFTFTVMNPAETECLGCVYINPLANLPRELRIDAAMLGEVGDDEAAVTFWVRPRGVADGLDERLLAALRRWFAESWAFRRVLFQVNQHQQHERAALERGGLRVVHTLHRAEEPQVYLLYDA